MDIALADAGALAIRGITPFFAELLRRIPSSADPGDHPEARERLFAKPTDESDLKFIEEWEDYVKPDLRQLFQTANETVAEDLSRLECENGNERSYYSLLIPIGHLEKWLNSLNQARLALAARNNFTDAEMDSLPPLIIETESELHLLQIQFYGYIQEVILRLSP